MALVYGELATGQNPGAASLATLWTADANAMFVITVANRGVGTSFRISSQIAAAPDVVKVYASLATLTFTINGVKGF